MMQPLSRRTALILGGAGAAAAATGAAGLLWGPGAGFQAAGGQDLSESLALHSADGRLQVKLSAAPGQVRIAGKDAKALSYNGSLPGPTLFLRAGDRLNVTLENRLEDPTNLHVHGLHVSPEGNSDNVLFSVEPGTSFDYEYRLPADHPPGVFWYHPHRHGMVADQIFGGLYGAIVVQDRQPIPTSRERVLVISDISLNADGSIAAVSAMEKMIGREGDLVLVNGQLNPRLAARPGERERWRIINACTGRYLKLRLDGQQLQLLGLDSGRHRIPRDVEEVLLPPGNRADLLVTAEAGTAVLRTLPVNRGSMESMMGSNGNTQFSAGPDGTALATFTGAGAPGAALEPVPEQPAPRAGQPVDTPRWQDVVNIPARSNVRVRIAFDDFTGKTVYHCHILDHEDSGMMGLIEAR